jgi:3-hydroxyisobutyrate dehydrogenase-like beta-hydroxyacid dehydrogenase
MRTTVLGAGRMGSAIASRLLDTGHEVTVWNRTPGKVGDLVRRGAREATSLAEAVGSAEVAFVMLSADDAVRAVVLADDGAANALSPDGVLIDSSTVSPKTTEAEVAALGARLVAAPVLGSPEALATGQATLVVGGEEATVSTVDTVLGDLAERHRYVGPAPRAAIYKLINNLMLLGGLATLAEAVVIGEVGGIPSAALRDFLAANPLLPAGLQNRLDDVVGGDHDGWFTTVQGEKDARLAAGIAAAGGAEAPLARLLEQRLREVAEAGYADADVAAIVEPLRPRQVRG